MEENVSASLLVSEEESTGVNLIPVTVVAKSTSVPWVPVTEVTVYIVAVPAIVNFIPL